MQHKFKEFSLLIYRLEFRAAEWIRDNRNIYGIGSDTMGFDPGNDVTLLSTNVFGLENVNNLGITWMVKSRSQPTLNQIF